MDLILSDLAAKLAIILAPLVPRLFTAGEKVTEKALEEAGTKLGGGAVDGLKTLVGRIREEPGAEKSARRLAEAPQDQRRAVAFELEVEEILRTAPDLATELARLLQSAGPQVAAVQGSGAVATHGSAAAGAGGMAAARDLNITYIRKGEGGTPDEAALRTAYLNWVIAEAGFVPLAGVDPAAQGDATRLQLESIYTGLRTLARGVRELPGQEPREKLGAPALAQLDEHPRLVLLGDPGSGKSTFLNFVAVCMAGELLGREDLNLNLLRSPLPPEPWVAPDQEELQPWRHGALLPVRVVLRELAAWGLPGEDEPAAARHLWAFVERSLTGATLKDYAPFLKQELLDGRACLLLDGLDEVPEAEQQREQIHRILTGVLRSFGHCRVLLTSRTHAYENQGWRLDGFEEAVLAPFSDGQIRRFISLWYAFVREARNLSREDASGRAALLERAVLGGERLRELARRPLLLTLIASLHAWRGGSLPEKRELLYNDAVELLLNRWEEQRIVRDSRGNPRLQQPSLTEWLKVDREQVLKLLEELAFEAHAQQAGLEGTANLDGGKLVTRLLEIGRKPKAETAELMEYLCHRAGLLMPQGVGVYTFPHRTFQEYLAARHLTDRREFPQPIAGLARREPDRWREVALLAGAKAARGMASSVWLLADALCRVPPDGPSVDKEEIWGAHLAGQVVAESAQLDAADPEKLARLQRWHVRLLGESSLPATERALAGKTLARLEDPRFDPKLWFLPKEPLLGFREVPAGSFLMGDGQEQHEVTLPTFYMARYPVTVAQFRVFVEAGVHSPEIRASLEGVSNHPVVKVTWHDALAYCRWLGERLKEEGARRLPAGGEAGSFWAALAGGRLTASLPSEAEWEKAARGTDGRAYPWEGAFEADRVNCSETKLGEPSTVGCFPGGRSPYGCEEMSGNVWEWTRSLWGKDWQKPAFPYPYRPGGDREDLSAPGEVLRVMRGGAYYADPSSVRCAVRFRVDPTYWYRNYGFRVVLLPFTSGL